MNHRTRILIGFATLGIVGLVVLYLFEFQWFQNYIQAKRLVVGALIAGLVVGAALAFFLQKKSDELVGKMQIWATCLIVPTLFMPLFASMANRFFAQQAKPVAVQFWEEKAYVMNRYGLLKGQEPAPAGYFLFVVKDGEMLRLENKSPVFPNAKQGDTVELTLRKGLFGAEFVVW